MPEKLETQQLVIFVDKILISENILSFALCVVAACDKGSCSVPSYAQFPPDQIREPLTDQGLGVTVIVENNRK